MRARGGLKVFGDSDAGWCAATPPNETTDEHGTPYIPSDDSRMVDPRSPRRRIHDDPDVVSLRQALRANNGLKGLEIVAPHEVERATRIFFRDGFVVVRGLLDSGQLARWRNGSARVLEALLEMPGQDGRRYITETGRLPHRYSYGTSSASRHLLHEPEWAEMVDLPTTTPLLKSIFGGGDYYVLGAGGDLCLPGAIEYQTLHSDWRESFKLPEARLRHAERMAIALEARDGDALDFKTTQRIYALTPPAVTINFFMCDLTWENGPIRQIPGTQARGEPPPSLFEEPEWMRLSTLVGAMAGDGVFRDTRAWHGATPNLSREIRAMPNVEYAGPWFDPDRIIKSLPHAIWETLSPHARHIARGAKCAPGVWPAGAGVMHPVADKRKEAKERSPG
jgi:hypothetical protein